MTTEVATAIAGTSSAPGVPALRYRGEKLPLLPEASTSSAASTSSPSEVHVSLPPVVGVSPGSFDAYTRVPPEPFGQKLKRVLRRKHRYVPRAIQLGGHDPSGSGGSRA
jgi:hypothetical protein